MKKSLALLLIAAAPLSLSACESMEFDDDTYAVPYTLERTARHEQEAAPAPVVVEETVVVIEEEPAPEPVKAVPAEKVFKKSQSK